MKKLLTVLFLFIFLFEFSNFQISHAPIVKIKEGTSTNWSGYAALGNNVTDARGSWIVPTVSCPGGNTYSSTWLGIDGYNSSTVEQIGTEQDCLGSVPRYYAWYEMYPKFSKTTGLLVNPGDVISARVSYLGNGNFQLTLTDQTTGTGFTKTAKNPSARRTSAEWIEEAPSSSGSVLLLANFGVVNLTASQATINGSTGSINGASGKFDAITMVNSSSTIKAQPSGLSADGSSFSISWFHN